MIRQSGASLLLVAFLALVGVFSSSAVSTAQELSTPQIVGIEVRGNARVESEAIVGQLELAVGDRLDIEQVDEDIRSLYRLGFFEDIVVRGREAVGGMILVVEVAEKPSIREISFEGNDEFDDSELNEKIRVREGAILDEDSLAAAARAIADEYREKGYYLAEVTWRAVDVADEEAPRVDIVFEIVEGSKIRIASVRFTGNEALSDDEIQAVIETRPLGYLSFLTKTGKFKEEAFSADLQRIRAFYYEKGYLDVSVGEPLVELGRDGQSLFVTIPVEEGEPYDIAGAAVTGNFLEGETEESLMELVGAVPGERFAASTVRGDMERIRTHYRDQGRAFADVGLQTQADPDTLEVTLIYDVEPGPVAYIGRIDIVGNSITRDRVIRQEMTLLEGQRYNATNIRESVAYVRRLGFFENVAVREERAGPGSDLLNIQIEVEERPTRQLQVGAGYSSYDGFIANAQISENNLFGRGQSLVFNLNWSRLTRDFELRFSERRLFGSRWQLNASVFNRHRVYPQFERDSVGASLGFGYELTRDLVMTVGWRAERVRSEARSDSFANSFYEQRNQRAIGPTAGLYFDTRNDRQIPTSGVYLGSNIEVSDTIFGGEQNYIKTRAFARFFWEPLWDFWIIRFNGEIGHVGSTRTGEETPITERFYLGGSQSIRGFRDYTISPCENRASFEDPGATTNCREIGGHKMLQFNLELEFPVVQALGLRGVLFMDAGNSFALRDPFSLRPDFSLRRSQRDEDYGNVLRTSVGFGIRWRSPIGPLRFEWGIPIAPAPGEKRVQFAFGIGNLF